MLPQNSLLHAHKMKLRWFVALSTLPLLGVVTAFGIMPQQDVALAIQRTFTADLALPPAAEAVETRPTYWHSEQIQRGDSVSELLRRMEVQDDAADNFLRRAAEAGSLRQLRTGKTVQAKTSAESRLLTLSYVDNGGNQITITPDGERFKVKTQPALAERRVFVQTGEISSSLYTATDEANLPDAVANQLVEIFGGDIDFHRDLRRGDTFSIIYEQP